MKITNVLMFPVWLQTFNSNDEFLCCIEIQIFKFSKLDLNINNKSLLTLTMNF